MQKRISTFFYLQSVSTILVQPLLVKVESWISSHFLINLDQLLIKRIHQVIPQTLTLIKIF